MQLTEPKEKREEKNENEKSKATERGEPPKGQRRVVSGLRLMYNRDDYSLRLYFHSCFNSRHFRECFITGAVRRTNMILYVNVCVRYWNWKH